MKDGTVLCAVMKKRRGVALWLMLSMGVGFFAPLKSFILQWIIDSQSVRRALLCLLGGVLVTVTSHVLELSSRRVYTKLACGAMADIRCRVMRKALARTMERAQNEEDAAYLSVLSADLRMLYDECFTPLFNIVFWGAILLCAIGMYLFVSPLLLLVVAVMSVPPLILPRLLNQRLARAREFFSENMARYTQRVKETLAGYETIRLFAREEHYEQAHAREAEENARSEERVQQSVNDTIVAASFLSNGTFIVILFFGMLQVFEGRISMGYMVTASQLANFIIQPCQFISQNYARLRSTRGIRARIEELMRADVPAARAKENAVPVDAGVECDAVAFAYPGKQERVLDGLSLHIQSGEKSALVGESGCGKSTLAKLLCRYHEDYRGSIRIGGAELRDIAESELLGCVGYISQKTFLFDDTIRNNITLYAAYPDEAVAEAVRISGLESMIAFLPDGLDTHIQENGKNISGGQAQRIGIARAAVRGYRLILADEITASLDEKTAEEVMSNLLAMNATVIAITHDTQGAFMQRFDSVYRMEAGAASKIR